MQSYITFCEIIYFDVTHVTFKSLLKIKVHIFEDPNYHKGKIPLVKKKMKELNNSDLLLIFQITTNSKLMSTADIEIMCRIIPIQKQNVTLLTLQSFDTEQQFSRKIKFVINILF